MSDILLLSESRVSLNVIVGLMLARNLPGVADCRKTYWKITDIDRDDVQNRPRKITPFCVRYGEGGELCWPLEPLMLSWQARELEWAVSYLAVM